MKLKRQQTPVLAISLAAATLSAFPLRASIEQSPASRLEETITPVAITLREIGDRLRRREVPGGSRGHLGQPIVCAIVPGTLVDQDTDESTTLQVWGLNPVFVWREVWTHLEVFRTRDHEVLLSQALDPAARHLVYSDGAAAIPLQPGEAYYWKLSRDGSDGQEPTFGETTFRTLDEEARLELEAKLTEIDTSEQALSQRVKFFADQELWADVFRELYSAAELPTDLAALKDEIAGYDFCDLARAISLAHRQSALH